MMKIGERDMNWIDDSLMNEMIAWAENNEDRSVFSEICEDVPSYYIDRQSKETYLIEYSFKTMAELKEALERYSGLSENSDILNKIVYAICQNRYRGEWEISDAKPEQESANDDQEKLPEFIYVF